MRIVINGWFSDQPTTGSGQYLAALLAWLPRVGVEHEFIVVRPEMGKRRNGEAEKRRNDDATTRRSDDVTNRQIGEIALERNTQYAVRSIQYAVRSMQYLTFAVPRFHPNLAKLWFEQVTFPWACRRLGAAVAFVPYWAPPLWSPCPVVVTIHDLIPLLLPQYRGGPLQRAYTALVSFTARRAAAILTDSAASQRDIIAHLRIPATRVHAIHLAADPRYAAVADQAELARVRTKYRLPDAPFLLYLGGFDARKNVVRMVEAFAQVVARSQQSGAESPEAASSDLQPPTPSPQLVIAGQLPAADTPFAPDPRPVVARLGLTERVHFIGRVDEADKPALYALALGTVFVSEYEGFGLPVLEAMMAEAGATREGTI